MPITTIILMNVLAALMLAVILSALMLAPSRLRRPFAEGHTHRQKAALRAQRRAEAQQRRRQRRAGYEPAWRSIQDV